MTDELREQVEKVLCVGLLIEANDGTGDLYSDDGYLFLNEEARNKISDILIPTIRKAIREEIANLIESDDFQ